MTRNWDHRRSATDRNAVVVSCGKVVASRAAFQDTGAPPALNVAAHLHATRFSNASGFGGIEFGVTREVCGQDIAVGPQQTGATSVADGLDGAALPAVAAAAFAILQGRGL